jgi:lipopolysaccharide transport system permease protein
MSTVMATMVDFLVSLAVLAIMMPIYHIAPGWPILLLPFWVLMLLMLSLGFGLVTAALMVTYRDVGYIVPVLTMMLMYASPVMYSVNDVLRRLPARFHPFYFMNPMTGLLEGFRWSLLNRGDMHWSYFIYPPICSIIVFLLGALAFQKMERRFADII